MGRSTMVTLLALAALAAAGCGEEEAPTPPPSSTPTNALERAVESATQHAEQAARIAAGAAEAAEEAARAAGEAAEAAEEISGEAASILTAVGYEDDRSAVQVVATKVGELVMFIPSTMVLTGGTGRRLAIYNDTEITHGIQIPGLGVETLLPAGQETEVELGQITGGSVYGVQCHLHAPRHRATLVVLPAR